MSQKTAIIKCRLTGVEWEVPFFPGSIQSEFIHPIFSVPLKTLWKSVPLTARVEWDSEETALFVLAVFAQTERIKFLPAKGEISEQDQFILFEESERVFSLVKRMQTIPTDHPLPQMIIQVGSIAENGISRIPDFLYILHSEIDQYHEGYSTKMERKENADRLIKLERFIRRNAISTKNRKALGKILGEWAAISAEFVSYTHSQPTPYGIMSLVNYWKHIIQLCVAGEDKLWQIPANDFHELLLHCEENLNHGTFYAAELMRFIREGARQARDGFGFQQFEAFNFLDKFETEKSVFEILDDFISPEGVQQPGKLQDILSGFVESMKLSAPTEEPKQSNFPSKLEFLRAKARWDLVKGGKK